MNHTKKYMPYGKQCIDEKDIQSVIQVLKSDYLTTGPVSQEFENKFSEYVGAEYSVSCSSGTAGLHLALLAIGITSSDKIIVPAISFLATANACKYVGADVEFCDVDENTGLLNVSHLEELLGKDTSNLIKAIIPVHLNGQCADVQKISTIAKKYNLYVVEDSCHALGSKYHISNKKFNIGSCEHSDLSVFSLHPVKNITMGEGGIVTTNSKVIYELLMKFRNHGITKDKSTFKNEDMAYDLNGNVNPWYYEMSELGFNYRASDIHCALGNSQLDKLDEFISQRKSIVSLYDKKFHELSPYVKPLKKEDYSYSAWHLYVIHIDFKSLKISRSELMNALNDNNIGTQVHYIPLYKQPYYSSLYGELGLPGAEKYYADCLSLPLFIGMTEFDVEYVVNTINEILNN